MKLYSKTTKFAYDYHRIDIELARNDLQKLLNLYRITIELT